MSGGSQSRPSSGRARGACPLVGIGASAGGLSAFRQFFSAVPADSALAYVVIQHLDPSHPSQLAELLQRESKLPVVRAADGARAVAGQVHVIPEGRVATVEDGVIRLRPRADECEQIIDILFTSLAVGATTACAVLLSGEGADGVQGLREISATGGLTFVQEPGTASHGAMPQAAIDAEAADFIAAPGELAARLNDLATQFGARPRVLARATKELPAEEAAAVGDILAIVQKDTGIDFSQYKRATVQRRIGRRAMLRDAETITAYLEMVARDADEVRALTADLLINVTQFFRDREVFDAVRRRAVPAILKKKRPGEPVRIWVPGCSTGEEVYSLLMTLLEATDDLEPKPAITVFGTDISETALFRARTGIYAEDVCGFVSPERLNRFFHHTEHGFEIDKSLREMCVFARQDITRDTPFSRLDLISLRNVLIYMDQTLQRKVLAVAHYALLPDGFLVLGTSETPDNESGLFRTYDKRHHIYRRQDVAPHLPLDLTGPGRGQLLEPEVVAGLGAGEAFDVRRAADEATLASFGPPRVIADANHRVVHFFGDTSAFLEHPEGRATFDVLEMAAPGLALDLRDALEEFERSTASVEREAVFTEEGRERHVAIAVEPLAAPAGQVYSLVSFRELPPRTGQVKHGQDLARLYEAREERLRQELAALRGRVRDASDEKDQANQSLRSANEEVRSSNEELQSINEELETAKEELQSANEELITVNEELRQRNTDLTQANDDVVNFFASTQIPVIMLDRQLRVRRYTPEADRIAHIGLADEGRLLSHLRLRIDVPDLEQSVRDVIENLEVHEREVRDEAGHWYAMQIRPYRTGKDHVEGAVMSFLDVDELRQSMDRVARRARLSEALNAIDAEIASTMRFDEIMQRALDQGVAALGADAGTIEMREGGSWVIRYQRGFRGEDVGLRLSEEDAPNATKAARLGRTQMIADLTLDEEANVGFVRSHGLKSMIAVPLIVRGEAIGCLLFYCKTHPRAFGRSETDFASRLGTSVSLAIENSRLLEAEMHSARTAQTLAKVNEILLSALTVDDVIARLVGEASEAAGAEKSLVIRVRGDEYTITDVRNVKADLVGKRKDATFYPGFALAVSEGHPILIEDNWSDPRTNQDFVVPYDLRAFQLLPLAPDDEVVAVLALAYDEPREFDQDDYDSALRMAEAMSMALRNALLYEAEQEAQRRAKRELEFTQVLLDSSAVFAEWTEIRPMLDHLADVLLQSAAHSRVTIGLWDEERRELATVVSKGEHPMELGVMAFDAMSAQGRKLIQKKKPVLIDYTKVKDESLRELIAERHLRYALAVPVVARGRLLGTITVDAPGEHQAFSDRETALIESIAGQAATAIENGRLFEAEREARQVASIELATANILLEAANELNKWPDLPRLLDALVAIVLRVMPGGRVTIGVAAEDRSSVTMAATGGLRAFPSGTVVPWERLTSGSRRALETGRTGIVDFERLAEGGIADEFASRLALYVPVKSAARVIGHIGVDVPGERHDFTPREIEILESIAAEAAVAIENARLFEGEREAQQQATRGLETTSQLLESARSLAGWTSLSAVLDQLAKSVHVATGRQRVFVHQWDEHQPALVLAASAGTASAPLGSRYEWDKIAAPSKKALTEKRTMVLDYDKIRAPEKKPYAGPMGYRVALAVPLIERSMLVGLVIVDDPGERHDFESREIELVEGIAAQATAAIRTARLFEAQQERARLAEALTLADTAIHSSLEPGEMMQEAVAEGARALGADTGALSLHRDHTFVVEYSHGFPTDIAGTVMSEEQERHGILALETRQPVIVEDVANDPRVDSEHVLSYGVAAVIVVPLVVAGEGIATLYYNFSAPRRFSAEEVGFARQLGSSLSLAFENARLFESEREAQQQATRELDTTQVLLDAAGALANQTSLDEVLQRLVESLLRAVGHSRASISLWNERKRELRMATSGGESTVSAGAIVALEGASPSVRKAIKQKKHVLADYDRMKDEQSRAAVEYGSHLALILPITFGKRLVGLISLDDPGVRREFTDREIEIAEGLCAQAASAIENARLFEAEQAELARTTLLKEIAAIGSSTLDLKELAERTLETTRRLLGATTGNLFVLDEDARVLRSLANFGIPEEALALYQEVPLDEETASGRVAITGMPVMHDAADVPDSTARVQQVTGAASSGWVILPVNVRGRTLGTLGLSFGSARPFEAAEMSLFQSLADQIGIAIEKAQLFTAERQRAERMTVLKEFAEIGATSVHVQDVGDRLADAIVRLLGASNAAVAIAVDGRLDPIALVGYPDEFVEKLKPLPDDTLAAQAYHAGEARFVENYETTGVSEFTRSTSQQLGFGSFAALPLTVGGAPIGAVGFVWKEPRHFDADEVSFLESIVAQAAIGLQNARLFEAEQAELARTTLLKDVAAAAAGTLELRELAAKVLDTAREHLGAKSGSVYLRDDGAGVLRHVALFGYPKKLLPSVEELPLDETSVAGRTVLRGELNMHDSPDVPEETQAHSKAARILENRWVILPIRSRGEVVGSVGFVFEEKRPFSEAELSLYRSIADQLGIAVEKTRAYEAEREARQQAKAELDVTNAILGVSSALVAATELDEVLGVIIDAITHSSPHTRVAISLWHEDRQEFEVIASRGEAALPVGRGSALTGVSSPARRVLGAGKSEVFDFDTLPEDERGTGRESGTRVALISPLLYQGRTLGLLAVDDAKERREFSERDIALIDGLAAQAAVAIEKARLLDATREAQRQAQRELETTELLLETADTLSRWTDVDTALERLAEILLRATDQSRVTVNLWDDKGQELRTVASKGESPMAAATFPAEILSPQIRGVLATQKTLLFDYDELEAGQTRRLAEARAIHLGLIVPIVYRSRILGLIGVDSPGERREFSEREIALVESVAAQASAAIQNAKLFEAEREAREQVASDLAAMTTLHRLGAMSLSEGNLEPVLQEILEAAIDLSAADFGNIQLLDPDSRDLKIVVHRGFPKWWLAFWSGVSQGQGVCGTALERGARVIVEDVERSPIFIGTPALDVQLRAGIRAVQSTPLISRSGKPLGMFSTHFKTPHRPDDRTLRLLDLLARQAADTIERTQAGEAIREGHERLQNVLDSMTDGFVSVDREWRFTLMNPAAEQLMHRSAAEVLGKSMEELYPDMFGWPHYRRVMKTREPDIFEVWSKPLETWLEIHAYPTAEGISILFTDISERKRAEQISQARLRMLTAAGTSEMSSDEIIRLVLDEIESLTASEIGFYHFVETDQETLRLQNWSSNTVATMCTAEGRGSHYPVSEAGVWVDAVRERRPVIHNDYAALPHRKGLPEGHAPVVRELVVPVMRNDRIVALIGVGNKPTDYDDADTDTVSYLGDLSWEMVERKRTEEELAKTAERLRILADSARLLLATDTPENVVQTIAEGVMEFLDCQAFFNYLMENDGAGMRLNAYAGIPKKTAKEISHLDLGQAVCGCVGRDGERIIAEDIQHTPDERTDLVKSFGIQAYVCHPLLYQGNTIGTLSFGTTTRTSFTAEEIELMRIVADQAATAMARKRAEDELRDSRAKLQHRTELLEGVNTVLDKALHLETEQELGEACLAIAEHVTGSSFGFIAEVNEHGVLNDIAISDPGWDACRMYDQSGHRRLPGDFEIHALYGRVVSDGKAFYTNDPASHSDSIGTPDGHPPLTSFLGVPLISGTRVFGMIALANRPGGYRDEDQQMLEALAPAMVEALERKRAEQELAEATQRLDAHISNSPLAVIEFDSAFRITRWSDEAERMFGWRADEVLGKAIGEFKWVYEEDVPLVDVESDRLSTGVGRSLNVNRNYRKDGSVIWCEWYDSAIYDAEGAMVSTLSQVLDITERKRAEEALRSSEQRYRLLFENMLDGFAYARMIYDDDGRPVDFVYLDVNESFVRQTGLEGVVGKPVTEVIPGIRESNPELFDIYGRVSLTGVPESLETYVEPLGIWFYVSVYGPQKGDFVAVFDNITERKTAEAQRERLLGEIETERSRLRAIIDEVPIGITLMDATGAVLEVNQATDALYGGTTPKAGSASEFALYEAYHHGTRRRMKPRDWPASRTIATSEVAENLVDFRQADGSIDTLRIRTVPVKDARGELVRIIGTAEDVSDQLARERLTRALAEIGTAISASLDFDEILRGLVEQSAMALGVDTAGLTVREGEDWVIKDYFGMPKSKARTALADHDLERTILAATEHVPIVIDDVTLDPRVNWKVLESLGICSLMAVPILVQRTVVGVLFFHHRTTTRAFSPAQIDFATRLMTVVTLALENARLYERELKIANTLQEAVLAPPAPIEGIRTSYLYRPASTAANVGGDFYDLFELADGRVVVLVGDVSGKGLEAARLTSMIRDGVRAYAYESGDPAAILERVNSFVYRSSDVEAYATLFFALLDRETGQLDYCSAGHPPAVVAHPGESRLLDTVTSPVVGAFPGTTYAAVRTFLTPDEVLVMYTDGVTEARKGHELFGEKRVLEAVDDLTGSPLAELPERIIERVLAFSGGVLRDDTVVVCLQLAP